MLLIRSLAGVQEFAKELGVLLKLRHAHIVVFYGIYQHFEDGKEQTERYAHVCVPFCTCLSAMVCDRSATRIVATRPCTAERGVGAHTSRWLERGRHPMRSTRVLRLAAVHSMLCLFFPDRATCPSGNAVSRLWEVILAPCLPTDRLMVA